MEIDSKSWKLDQLYSSVTNQHRQLHHTVVRKSESTPTIYSNCCVCCFFTIDSTLVVIVMFLNHTYCFEEGIRS